MMERAGQGPRGRMRARRHADPHRRPQGGAVVDAGPRCAARRNGEDERRENRARVSHSARHPRHRRHANIRLDRDSRCGNGSRAGLGFCLNHVEESFGLLFQLKGQPDEYVEFDTSALLRSAFKDRIDGLVKAVQGGVLSPDEARELEGYPKCRSNSATSRACSSRWCRLVRRPEFPPRRHQARRHRRRAGDSAARR